MNKILVVDDDKFYREQLKGFLLKEGYEITLAVSGAEAIREFKSSEYHAVILDVHMEDINGKQLLAIMKNIHPQVPLIVVTGDNSLELEREIRTYGVFYYLIKPFSAEEVTEVIRSAVSRKIKHTS